MIRRRNIRQLFASIICGQLLITTMKSRRTTSEVLASAGYSSSSSSSAAINGKSAEELRSAHIRTLEALSALKKENAELTNQVAALERSSRGNPRMKQEELDSLYVEERRIIERLERENKELKASAAGARAGRDSDVAAAQAEAKRLKEQCEELRDAVRRGGRLASEQLERQRLAYQGQLDESAQECEEQRRRCAEAELELGVERSRADSLERKLGEARRALESAPPAASGVENEMVLRQQLSAALLRADMSEEAAGKASRRVEAVEKEAVVASEAARKEMQRLSDGLEVAEAAAREERG